MSKTPDIRLVLREVLGTPSGREVVAWLESTVLNIELPASATDAELRHFSGRRSLARQMLNLAREPV